MVICSDRKLTGNHGCHRANEEDEAGHAGTAERLGAHELPDGQTGYGLQGRRIARTGFDYSPTISQSWVISAVLPSMIEAEQYFSAESWMARSTASAFRLLPRTVKWK